MKHISQDLRRALVLFKRCETVKERDAENMSSEGEGGGGAGL